MGGATVPLGSLSMLARTKMTQSCRKEIAKCVPAARFDVSKGFSQNRFLSANSKHKREWRCGRQKTFVLLRLPPQASMMRQSREWRLLYHEKTNH
jgi:hypothetical protein